MRTIDADALVYELTSEIRLSTGEFKYGLEAARLHVMDAPTIQPDAPRVMTWEEAQANVNEGPFIVIEVRDSTGTEIDYGILVDDLYELNEGSILTVHEFGLLKDDYGKRFRCWTARPTDEQRKAVKWDD